MGIKSEFDIRNVQRHFTYKFSSLVQINKRRNHPVESNALSSNLLNRNQHRVNRCL